MRYLALLSFVLVVGCEEPEENFEGTLVRVEVVATRIGCSPARFTGDAGLQFFGVRADGGVLFTMGQQAVYGPALDGGVLSGVQRQLLPSPNEGITTVGDGCRASLTNWERVDGGLSLYQEWPGQVGCPMAPPWLPKNQCESTRVFNFTEVGTCELRCVQLSATSGEVECKC